MSDDFVSSPFDAIRQYDQMGNDTHYEVGKEVRETIKRLGGTMPEHLPKPEKSVDQIEKERKWEIQKFLQRREQPLLPVFGDGK